MADAKKPTNIWARSADPQARREATERHSKNQSEREMRTKNVMRQSAWDRMRGKNGKQV